jgi:hypothetical protein
MKVTIVIITATQTTSTIQNINSNRKSILGPKVEMSCGKYRCSSIEASPLRYQCADAGLAFTAPKKAADATCQHLPIHGFGAIMPVRASISEMKNPFPQPQPALNHRRQ